MKDLRRKHPLATLEGLELIVTLLVHSGAMCPKCGYGTRTTSKNWARCKRCGERVARRALPAQQPPSGHELGAHEKP